MENIFVRMDQARANRHNNDFHNLPLSWHRQGSLSNSWHSGGSVAFYTTFQGLLL